MVKVKKILKRGIIIGLLIVLVAFLGMGIIDIVVFAIIGLLVLILAAIMTLVHNRKDD